MSFTKVSERFQSFSEEMNARRHALLLESSVERGYRVEYIKALVESRESDTPAPFRQFMIDAHTRWLER